MNGKYKSKKCNILLLVLDFTRNEIVIENILIDAYACNSFITKKLL